jgi:long-chain acyl-CoA synthetase
LTEENKKTAEEAGLNVYLYNEILSLGEENPDVPFGQSTGDSVFMLSYTSGSTGDPKGVEITHENVISGYHGAHAVFPVNP